ncbi:uncharacterized protein [Drosophila virilis]|uniref:uncharacterized protein n=1 Tax=Drosophila virilis TaxID=7244 RepID=UPI0013961C5C|nr:uncharacterized protein LOC116650881 [Drosophila virilis]
MADLANKPVHRLSVVWKSFNCDVNSDIVTSRKCSIVDAESTLLTTEIIYNQDFHQYNASFSLYTRPTLKEFQRIFKLNIDLCQFHKTSLRNQFLDIAYKSIVRDSNFPKKCPHPKGLYYFRNINVAEHLPLIMPTGDFKLYLNLFTTDCSQYQTTQSDKIGISLKNNNEMLVRIGNYQGLYVACLSSGDDYADQTDISIHY